MITDYQVYFILFLALLAGNLAIRLGKALYQ